MPKQLHFDAFSPNFLTLDEVQIKKYNTKFGETGIELFYIHARS